VPELVFATCDQQPLITRDDQILADALSGHGGTAVPIPWTEIDPYAVLDSPPILLRSTWDYHRVPTMFMAWLQALEASGRPVWNPAAVARRNIDKSYLRELEASGIAIPRTRWLDAVDRETIRRVLEEEDWPRAVLKPRIAATAYGTFLVDRDTALSDSDLAPVRASGALLQELVPEVVTHGEISSVYFDGAFSHAVRKHAANGDFRVQKDFGGRVVVTTLTDNQRAFTDRVVAVAPPDCLYQRIDIVDSAKGPLLMELELIEPELYFTNVPSAATTLAALIAGRLA